MLLFPRLLSAAVLATAISGLLAQPTAASARQIAGPAAQAGTPMCIDAPNRTNGTDVRLWQCMNHNNQKCVIDGGQIKVKDTLA
ncbi:hypothetical protein [Nonomuraea sp. NPDC049750]|uniref:hypothetical protein n=1 Tax=Nonomuraea sp. NPDC049750 TaxID=3154738 RepID=UPI0033E4BC97